MKKILVAVAIIVVLIVGIKLIKPQTKNTKIDSPKALFQKDSSTSFKQLLEYVPKETSFLFGNREPIPSDYLETKLENFNRFLDKLQEILTEDNSSILNENSIKSIDFIRNYSKEFIKNYKSNTLEQMGYSKSGRVVIYEYKSTPVLRLTIANSKNLIDSINSIAKESNLSLEWKECGGFKCLSYINNSLDLILTLVVKERNIALSIHTKESRDKIITHLTQKPDIKNSYPIEKFDKFLKENGFRGYGDGFIKIEKLVENLISTQELILDKNCSRALLDIAKRANRLSIGTLNLSKKESDILIILNLDKNLTDNIKNITNKEIFTKRVKRPIFDFGLNLNAEELSKAIIEFSNYLIEISNRYGCIIIDEDKLRNEAFVASLSIGIVLKDISQLYLALNRLEIDKKTKDISKVSALIQIVSSNPTALIDKLKMLHPKLASLEIPTNGEEIDIPKALNEPLPPYISQFKVSIDKGLITIQIGERVETKKTNLKENTLLWSRVYNRKYYKLREYQELLEIEMALQNIPKTEKEEFKKRLEEIEKIKAKNIELIELIYDVNSTTSTTIYFDNRGVVLEMNKREE